MNATLIDDESNSDNPSESLNFEVYNFMAFASRVISKSDKESEKVEDIKCSEHSEEDYEVAVDIRKAYEQLFRESLKVKKINRVVLKKVNKLELKREKLISDF